MEDVDEYVCSIERVQCPAIPRCSPQSLQAAMQLVNIQTLAFTPPRTLPWRVYLYTHTQPAHSGDTPRSTLILGELLYAGAVEAKEGVGNGEAAAGRGEERVSGGEEAAPRKDGEGEQGVKVTLKQQPRDDKALRGFLSILTTVLHTLSSEGN